MEVLKNRKEAVIDVINVVAAVVLFIAPWAFGFAGNSSASWNAWVTALVVGAVAAAALVSYADWEEWVNLVLGVWAIVAPWALGFAEIAAAMWSHVLVGLVVAALAACELWLTRQPPRVTA